MNADHQPTARSFALFYFIGIALVAGSAWAAWTFWTAREAREAAEAKQRAGQQAAGPGVVVARSQRGPNVRRLVLVGEALPVKSVTLYSKVSGYLSRITVDVGDRVKAGQVIAEVQSPELDAQIATIVAGLDNKRQIARRTAELASQGFFSQQALDNARTEVRVAEAQIAELRTLGGYRVLRAPFAGVVTARYADPGALVTNAASNQTAALPVVSISDTARLKVTVYAEQAEATAVRAGLEAEVADAAAPERKRVGTVARVSGELDARTRTLRTEVEFDNADGGFLPGSFVNVALLLPATSYVEVPAGALVTRDKKPMVGTVDGEQKVHFVPVQVAGTDGKVVRIASGLEENVTVALNPPPGLAEGSHVVVQAPPGASKPAAAPAASPPAPAKPAPAGAESPKAAKP
jgi:membrane fusion protein (multidrug efflux system)